MPIPYVVDAGPLSEISGNEVRDNASGRTLIASAAGVWQSVPTAAISFQEAALTSIGDGDIDTLPEYAAAEQACDIATQNPVIFDADGSLLRALGGDPFIIGFAGPCALDGVTGHIRSALLFLNGQFVDGVSSFFESNPEISMDQFEETAVHELGHFLGLDHAQINGDILNTPTPNCSADDLAGLPVMFPFLSCQARKSAGLPVLAPDDSAWISKLYPSASFTSTYGMIRGFIYFPDGISQFQGANVIAQAVDDPGTPADESKRMAVSSVSGFLFTNNPGQAITGNNTGGSSFGSRDPAVIGSYEIPVLPGTYTVYVENVRSIFTGGSSVGPFDPPAVGVPEEYWNAAESNSDGFGGIGGDPITVLAGQTVSDINIILDGSRPRFDDFEDGVVEFHTSPNDKPSLSPVMWLDRRRA